MQKPASADQGNNMNLVKHGLVFIVCVGRRLRPETLSADTLIPRVWIGMGVAFGREHPGNAR